MGDLVSYLDPAPRPAEVRESFPSPFAQVPSSLAQRAAQALQAELRSGFLADLEADFTAPGRGKMFGVLVVADPTGRVGFIRGVSGMLGAQWQVPGLVPPAFDLARHDKCWPEGQRQVDALEAARHAFAASPQVLALRERGRTQQRRHKLERDEMKRRHNERRVERRRLRGGSDAGVDTLRELEEQSRADKREERELRAIHVEEHERLVIERSALDAELRRRKAESVALCNRLLDEVRSRYDICNALGHERSLCELFAPKQPPGGTGDCAGPKLLRYAFRHGLRPLAMAEFWWGASPAGGGRHSGQYYPACRGKCGPLLTFMLTGLAHDPAPAFATEVASERALSILFEDEHMIAADKPEGMLSVPGRGAVRSDSALKRLQAQRKAVQSVLAVHRLDMDTSGILLFAKSQTAHRALQALFAERKIDKRYRAWLAGEVQGQGRIDLPLRVDLDDRPRQIVCHEHGKAAQTDYVVLRQHGACTEVELRPHSGRTHQLRVHCAHPDGLAHPIVGDRLYGMPGPRLLLHAESLCFQHPMSGDVLTIHSPAPATFKPPTI